MKSKEKFVVVMEKEYIGYPLYKSKGCTIIEPYSMLNQNKLERKIKGFLCKMCKNPLIGVNEKLIGASNVFLMYDSISPSIVKYIREKNPNARIIVYYINPVQYSFNPNDYAISQVELWTFDDKDAERYGMKWNPLHYFATEIRRSSPKEVDIAFVGADKGRYKLLIQLESLFRKHGLKTDFHITANTNTPFYDRKKYRRRLSYRENMEHIFRSKAILDILQKNQYGYTMRIPEAMVNHIKLITNNRNINKYPFYCADNVFILGIDDQRKLSQFINSPWNSAKDEVIKNLEYEFWISKFEIN